MITPFCIVCKLFPLILWFASLGIWLLTWKPWSSSDGYMMQIWHIASISCSLFLIFYNFSNIPCICCIYVTRNCSNMVLDVYICQYFRSYGLQYCRLKLLWPYNYDVYATSFIIACIFNSHFSSPPLVPTPKIWNMTFHFQICL